MSQSDYLKYKKISTTLIVDMSTNMLPILNSQDYSDYKEFVLENTVSNSKVIYRKITPINTQVVLGMDKNKTLVQNMGTLTSNCPSFLLCNNTNRRPNRVPIPGAFSVPTPQPLNWQKTKNASNLKTACKCILNSSYTNTNICKCKLGR